uniref:Uncharacterized protein n=1 Tax=Sphaeramia orbicularis TaxID=375764 RepID=A0A673AUI8_9TELE
NVWSCSLFIFMCLAATRQCRPSPALSYVSIVFSSMSLKGEIKAYGAITYDSTANKLLGSDQMKGIFYEIDSKNQSCVKKSLQSTAHPLDIPDDNTYYTVVLSAAQDTCCNESICNPVIFYHSLMEVEHEITDPDLLVVPSFCENHFLNEFV